MEGCKAKGLIKTVCELSPNGVCHLMEQLQREQGRGEDITRTSPISLNIFDGCLRQAECLEMVQKKNKPNRRRSR